MTQAGDAVALSAVDFGKGGASTGALQTVTVKDFRGGPAGWSLTGKVTDFTGPGAKIDAGSPSWTPACATKAGSPSTCRSGSSGTVGTLGSDPGVHPQRSTHRWRVHRRRRTVAERTGVHASRLLLRCAHADAQLTGPTGVRTPVAGRAPARPLAARAVRGGPHPCASRTSSSLSLLSCALVLRPPPPRAADNGSWSVYPVASRWRAAVLLPLRRPRPDPQGQGHRRQQDRRPLTFRLYAADAYNTARDGGSPSRPRSEKQRGVGAWARPARSGSPSPRTDGHRALHPPGPRARPNPATTRARWSRSTNGSTRASDSAPWGCGGRSAPVSISGWAGRPFPRSPSRGSGSPTTSPSSPASATAAPPSPTPSTTAATSPSTPRSAKGRGPVRPDSAARDLNKIPSELLPGQRVRLTEPWHGRTPTRLGRRDVDSQCPRIPASRRGCRSSRCRG